jgi:hypothetical protein
MSVNQRQEVRMSLNIPVRISGIHPDGVPWEEMSTTSDASRHGASFVLDMKVEKGEVLLLTLPLPKRFRAYDINDQSYKVYSLVRSVIPVDKDTTQVGVLFLGRNAPRDYAQNPARRYLLPSDPAPKPSDRRREERRTVFVTLKLIRMGTDPQEELTVAEDMSRGGSRVPTSLPVAIGEVVTVEELGGSFRSRAEVRNLFVGEDRITRLNLQFLDGPAPERLLG